MQPLPKLHILGVPYLGDLLALTGQLSAVRSLVSDESRVTIYVPGYRSEYFNELMPGQVVRDGASADPPGNSGATFTTEFDGTAGGHQHSSAGFNNGAPPSRHYGPGEYESWTVGPACGVFNTIVMAGPFEIHAKSRVSVGQGTFEHIGSSPNYLLIGSTGQHPSNHWGLSHVNEKLRAIAAEYKASTGTPLYFNDMSLPWGGIFDIQASWSPPHAEHRNGNVIDIAATPETLLDEALFIKIMIKYTANYLLEGQGSSRHYHVRF